MDTNRTWTDSQVENAACEALGANSPEESAAYQRQVAADTTGAAAGHFSTHANTANTPTPNASARRARSPRGWSAPSRSTTSASSRSTG